MNFKEEIRMRILILIITTILFFTAAPLEAIAQEKQFICDIDEATNVTHNCRYETTEETKFCRFMRQPSESELELRDKTRAICRAEGYGVCSAACMEIHLERTLEATDELVKEGFFYLGQGARMGAEKAQPYWDQLMKGWKSKE